MHILFISVNILLGYIGGKPIENPYLIIGQILTLVYFLFFPLTLILEQTDYLIMKTLFAFVKKNEVIIPRETEIERIIREEQESMVLTPREALWLACLNAKMRNENLEQYVRDDRRWKA